MSASKQNERPAATLDILRRRVDRLFKNTRLARDPRQCELPFFPESGSTYQTPTDTLSGFIDFLAAALPHGEIYLFGGVLRDLAFYGRNGFSSDVDIVVEGDWLNFVRYLEGLGAKRNKFGGYRLSAGEWPIDVWNAEETWAIRQGIVVYTGIEALTRTTVLNWDAILMNWRSKRFVCSNRYLDDLQDRSLHVVLENNPNPLGMAVRVFRHLSTKDARRVSPETVGYLENCTEKFSFEDLSNAEFKTYSNNLIEPVVYRLFSLSRRHRDLEVDERFVLAIIELGSRGDGASWRQLDLKLAKFDHWFFDSRDI